MTVATEPLDQVQLPPVLDTQAAAPLLQSLLNQRGGDLHLDGAAVQRVGGQCLQILLAAQAAWAADSCALTIVSPSAELLSAFALLGVDAASPLMKQEYLS